MRSKLSCMAAYVTLALLAFAPITAAQLWTSPTLSREARDKWCRDVGAPIGSPPLPPGPYKVGSNELPFCYLPNDVKPPELLTHLDPVFTGSIPKNYLTTVFLSVFVGTEGQPLRISIGRVMGYGLYDAAMDEVKR